MNVSKAAVAGTVGEEPCPLFPDSKVVAPHPFPARVWRQDYGKEEAGKGTL